MALKSIVAKKIKFASAFGKATFHNVPVLVSKDAAAKDFDPTKDEYLLGADIGLEMERQLASQWFKNFFSTPDKVAKRRVHREEVYAIMQLLGVNATSFAKLIGITKGQISKILSGKQDLSLPAAICCIALLSFELQDPGSVKSGRFFETMQPDEPIFDLKRLA